MSLPCRGLVSPEDYGKYITRVRQILNGETVELENVLKDEMSRLSEEWKFEEAQVVKEKYEAVRKYNAKSVIGEASENSADMFAYVENEDRAFVNFMHLNRGAVTQSLNLEYRRQKTDITREEILSMAVAEIGERFDREFKEVIVPFMPDVEFEGVRFVVPSRGDKKESAGCRFKECHAIYARCREAGGETESREGCGEIDGADEK